MNKNERVLHVKLSMTRILLGVWFHLEKNGEGGLSSIPVGESSTLEYMVPIFIYEIISIHEIGSFDVWIDVLFCPRDREVAIKFPEYEDRIFCRDSFATFDLRISGTLRFSINRGDQSKGDQS